MRLFKVITVLISLLLSSTALAGNTTPGDTKGHIGDMPAPVWLGDDIKYSMPAFLFRRTQFLRFSLKREEKKMHESAVFFALTSTQNGKIVSWYSKERLAAGKVRVIHSYPIRADTAVRTRHTSKSTARNDTPPTTPANT
jgi:hypothetical protein